MNQYRYTGPLTSIKVAKVGDVCLFPGGEYKLPSDDPHVIRLAALGYLTEVPQPQAVPASKSKKGDDSHGS